MDLGIRRESFSPPEDQWWLGSAHGTNNCKPITLDADSFLSIWTDGVVPSGIALVYDAAVDLWKPRGGMVTNEVQTLTDQGVFETQPDWESMLDATVVPKLYNGDALIWEPMNG